MKNFFLIAVLILTLQANAANQLDQVLINAIDVGNLAAVKNALNQGANPNTKDDTFKTPVLIQATLVSRDRMSDTARLEIVKALIEKGADVNIEGEPTQKAWGYTAVMGAANNGHANVIRYLVANGANVNAVRQGVCPVTALWLTAYTGQDDAARVLIAAKADVNFKGGCFNKTPLATARVYSNFTTAKIIEAAGGHD